MTLFTENPLEKMMVQRPTGRRDSAPPVPKSPACMRCPYKAQSPCNGNCILLDDGDECVCPQLISYSLLCKWFRVAVLPADRLLYAELYQTGDKKKCTECGAFFASTSNSVKYCPVCRKRITRRQAAERMRKRRTPVTQ